MNDFVRFDDRPVQPGKPAGMLEYLSYHHVIDGRKVADEFRDHYDIRSAVKLVLWVWRTRCPPTTTSGVYAFVNTPENINLSIVPSYVTNLMAKEFETMISTYNNDFEATAKNVPWVFKLSHLINIDQVRVVWAHHIIDWVEQHFEWKRYTAQEYLKISDKSDIYEVFLELR